MRRGKPQHGLAALHLWLLVSSCAAAAAPPPVAQRARAAPTADAPAVDTNEASGAPAPAPAPTPSLDGPSTVSTFRFAFHINMHTGFGAQGRHRSSEVRLELFETGGARVDDIGERRDYAMHSGAGNPRVTRTTRPWRDRWEGAWVRDNETLTLTLHLTADECLETTTEEPGPDEEVACEPPPDELRLMCAHTDSPETRGAWICTPSDAMLGAPRTALPWGFEEGGCLAATLSPGRQPRRVGYERCASESDDG